MEGQQLNRRSALLPRSRWKGRGRTYWWKKAGSLFATGVRCLFGNEGYNCI